LTNIVALINKGYLKGRQIRKQYTCLGSSSGNSWLCQVHYSFNESEDF